MKQNIFDPLHNLREIAKQLLLLENHLCNPARRCGDCIAKHLLTMEAFAEEAAELDKGGRFQGIAYALANVSRQGWELIFHTQAPPQQIQQWLRAHRKKLVGLLRTFTNKPPAQLGG